MRAETANLSQHWKAIDPIHRLSCYYDLQLHRAQTYSNYEISCGTDAQIFLKKKDILTIGVRFKIHLVAVSKRDQVRFSALNISCRCLLYL